MPIKRLAVPPQPPWPSREKDESEVQPPASSPQPKPVRKPASRKPKPVQRKKPVQQRLPPDQVVTVADRRADLDIFGQVLDRVGPAARTELADALAAIAQDAGMPECKGGRRG